jgi:hypothetical protein
MPDPTTTKTMKVQSQGFPSRALKVNKNVDSVHFVQKGASAPGTVTVPATLFADGTTTCIVDPDPNPNEPHLYLVVGGAGDYTVCLPKKNPTLTNPTGTIRVNG